MEKGEGEEGGVIDKYRYYRYLSQKYRYVSVRFFTVISHH